MKKIEELKEILKKAKQIKKDVITERNKCNMLVYTPQNEEDLRIVKAFIEFKLNLIDEIILLAATGIQNFRYESEIGDYLQSVKKLQTNYNKTAKDEYYSNLLLRYMKPVKNAEASL